MGVMVLYPLKYISVYLIVLTIGLSLSKATQKFISDDPTAPFFFRTWQTQQGLPNNTIKAITQTRDGYLWLGTSVGLARFDGLNFRVFGVKDGLINLQITALEEDSQGALWFGTAGGGVGRMFQGRITTYTAKDGLAGDNVNCLLVATNGDIWIGTTAGLSCLRNGLFQPTDAQLNPSFIFSVVQDRTGKIWIATLLKGLYCGVDGKFSSMLWPTNDPIRHMPQINARCLMVDDENRLWLGMRDRAVNSFKDGKWTGYGTNQGLPYGYASCLAQTPDGAVWVGTEDKGLYCLPKNGRRFIALTKSDGLPDGTIGALYSSHTLNPHLWVGTLASGLARLNPKLVSVYHPRENGFETSQFSIAQTTNGNLWVGAFGQGIYQWQSHYFKPYLPTLGRQANSHLLVEAILATTDGSLWWGASSALLQSKNGALISTNHDGEPWLKRNRVLSLCENRDGGIWVGLDNGKLYLVNGDSVTPVDSLAGKPVVDLAQEKDGTLWIATLGGGLGRLQNGKLTMLTTKDGLTSNLIRTVYLDAEGTLWIGTEGGGLNRWAHGRLSGFTMRDGLPDDIVLQILDDDDGDLWLGCNRGICCVSKRELDSLANGIPNYLRPMVFGLAEGMDSEQCAPNFNAALKTKSGQLCFSTVKGIVVINPHQQNPVIGVPTVLIDTVLVDNQVLKRNPENTVSKTGKKNSASPPVLVPPGEHHYDFRFTGIDFDAPEKIQFRYRLDGLDSDWNRLGNVREAIYAPIPPGTYRFRVQARNYNGVWSDPGAAMEFTVLRYFWQEAWFKFFVGILGVFLLSTGIRQIERRRYRARLKRIEQEQAMERERMRIARDLHDELGANLTHISLLSDMGSSVSDHQLEKFKKRVHSISSVSVQTLRSLDQIVWAVNPRNDSLRSLILYLTQFARELFEDTGIQCRFETEENLPTLPLPPEVRHNLFLVIKEALNNALKHSAATEICLSATTSEENITICVHDNGNGCCPVTLETHSQRNGLGNMRQRVEALGGQLIFESHPGQGTTLRLIVKYPGTSPNKI